MKKDARIRLIEERKLRNWSQAEVADRLGTNQRNVSRWELGLTTPGPYFRAKLCELFGKRPQELGLVEHAQQSLPASATANAEGASTSVPATEVTSTLWTVPYPRNPFFTGRDPLLEQLHQQLTQEHRVALSQSTVLSGLGGIGKTATAIEYAYRHVHDYPALFWIGAETAERLVSSFVTLAETLQLPERLESEKPQIVSAVLRWLSTHQSWLLIFDNVEELEMVKPFVPTAPHGSILFTTRLQAVGTLAQQVTVETMGLAEGTLFLLRRAKLLQASAFLDQVSSELLAEAESLVIELDFLPLAIDQAGAYLEEVGCSPATYLELYRSRRKELLHRRGHTPSDHPESVATTWSLSFQRIEQRNPAAADLLRMCAFLEPDAIPEELLKEGGMTLGSLMQAVAADTLAFHTACEELYRFSLVQRDPQARLLRVHRLVQAVLKDSMEIQEQEQWVEHMLRTTGHFLNEFREGIRFFTSSSRLISLLIAILIATFGGVSLTTLGVYFVTNNLHIASNFFGVLDAMLGVGVVGGGLCVGALTKRVGLERNLGLGMIAGGLALFVFARMTVLLPALVFIFLFGIFLSVVKSAINTLLLHLTPPDFIGRIMSIFVPLETLASLFSTALVGFLVSTVLPGQLGVLLGMSFGRIDSIYTVAGGLFFSGGCYALMKMRIHGVPSS